MGRLVDNFNASKLARYWFFKDKRALARSMAPVLVEWDFDRVIINHGEILETGGKQKLREVFAFLG